LSAQTEVTDDLGRVVRLPAPAVRIVSLAPSVTESLFALGAESQVCGVTDYCNYPPAALGKQRVGGMTNPSIETIIALRPDLIIVSMEGNAREDFDRLTRLEAPVFVTNPRTLEGINRTLEELGRLTGRTAESARLAGLLKQAADSVRALGGDVKIRALCIVSVQPLIVVGRNTFLNELLGTAGADNVAARLPFTYPGYSREAVVAEDPDVILVMSDIVHDRGDLERLFPEWKGLSAVKHERIYSIDADIVSRPGPRAVEGLAELYQLLHRKVH
jgi:iron complex transport system substrate-binding protein